jgi:hypothetical protein
MPGNEDPMRILAASQVPGKPLYIVGTFDTGVTVLSQQTGALNLAWALIESSIVPALAPRQNLTDKPKINIAIVGAGFAGLSVAGGLIKKGAYASIIIFEQRDTLLPLQHGSDTRWLHPNIYNWPAEGSEANAAMLPVLNWTAARASDVVVQVLMEWKGILGLGHQDLSVYCNTRHLQIHDTPSGNDQLQIEWIGEQRDCRDGTIVDGSHGIAVGETGRFDLVIVAVGFGLERERAHSYWRNDTLGQPNLEQPRLTYLVSGQGDGAMIDLLRLRISHYRQDRVLGELFKKVGGLKDEIKHIYEEYQKKEKPGIFEAFEGLSSKCDAEFKSVRDTLGKRLRLDTDVILHLKLRKLSELFEFTNARISFQNKLLVYLLYKCGGFIPSMAAEDTLIRQHSIPEDRVIRRHGPARDVQLEAILSEPIFEAIRTRRGCARPDPFEQSDKPAWPGGYFGFMGSSSAVNDVDLDDEIRFQLAQGVSPGANGSCGRRLLCHIGGNA